MPARTATRSTKKALPRVAYSVAEAAEVLGYVDDKALRPFIVRGELRHFRLAESGEMRISAEALTEFIAKKEKECAYEY